MALTNEQIARLNSSFGLIKPRLGMVAELFEQAMVDVYPEMKSLFPIDRVSFELNMLLLCGHLADLDLLHDRIAEMGDELHEHQVYEHHFPAARDAMLRAFASVLGYTWTSRLSEDWEEVFDHIGHMGWTTIPDHSQAA